MDRNETKIASLPICFIDQLTAGACTWTSELFQAEQLGPRDPFKRTSMTHSKYGP